MSETARNKEKPVSHTELSQIFALGALMVPGSTPETVGVDAAWDELANMFLGDGQKI
ncbi:MAG TPA: hypothetical protein VJ836_00430 [Candidatus Saccharimonadales bacterium]|nr:hypothetical protein [Candidatus Saccharimonadales bacterium]